MYIMEPVMNVGKWGNSLAVRLPKAVVEALGLKEGDAVKMNILDGERVELSRDMSREEALKTLRKYRGRMPAGFKFNRQEANER
jgi:antitoxin MazE